MSAAVLQRLIVCTLLMAAGAVLVVFSRLGLAWLGAFAMLVVLSGHAWVIAAELACLWRTEAPSIRPRSGDLLRAWWGESLVAPLVFCWRQPFRSAVAGDRLPTVPDGRRGVLLVHGLLCNRGFWTPWLRRLDQLGYACLAIDLEPAFASIETYSPAIDRAVARLASRTGAHPVIVAHSMGGLAVRHWLSEHQAADRIHHVITIGTPHGGTWLARFARYESGRQMRVGSEWLQALASRESSDASRRFTCFYASCDNVVFPMVHAQWAGADNRGIGRTAHIALAFKGEVWDEAMRLLQAEAVPSNA